MTSSSPALSGVTSVPNGGIPAVVGGHPTPPGHPPHGHIPPHPFHPASAGLPHGPHGQHPHFHPHLGNLLWGIEKLSGEAQSVVQGIKEFL